MHLKFLFLHLSLNFLKCEIFTSIGQLQMLAESIVGVTRDLEALINQEEDNLKKAKDLMIDFYSMTEQVSKDTKGFIANPINSFLLIKKLSNDYNKLLNTISNSKIVQLFDNQARLNYLLPNEEDYIGAIQAIHRLEDTYNLNTTDIRLGRLSDKHPSRHLNAFECSEFGRISFEKHDYYHALRWYKEALNQVEEEEKSKREATVAKIYLLDRLSNSTFQQGNINHAFELNKQVLEIDENYPYAKEKSVFLKKMIEEMKKNGSFVETDEYEIKNKRPKGQLLNRDLYEYLCREEPTQLPPKRTKTLFCKYMHHDPFLIIAPVKAELIYDKPQMWLFYDIITNEIGELMKKLAIKRLNRAKVNDPKNSHGKIVEYRISKCGWLFDNESPKLSYMTKLVSAITNLTLETAEEWQIANYGIGGQYEPHLDFAKKSQQKYGKDFEYGNRVATLLIYLEAPEKGGATVFPNLKLAIQPRKNTAAFWFNLHTSGDGDFDTLHAACPILIGSKWVSNKWIHLAGQEFRRPCSIKRENSLEMDLN